MASSTLFFGCGGDRPSVEGESLPELVVASDYYAPYIYRDEKGDFVGIDVELITEICKHVGLKPVFRHIDWSGKNEVLSSGGADCLCGSFSLTGREDEYSWTLPYMNSRQVVAVPQDSDIYWISDLKDKRVAVQATTKPDEIFSGKKNEKIVVPKLKELNCFPDITYIVAALNGGFVDAIAGHEVVLREYMKSSSVKIRILEDVKTDLTEDEFLSMLPEEIDPIGISETKVKNCLVRYFLYKNEIVITEVRPLPEEEILQRCL